MTKLIRSLAPSVIIVFLLASCNLNQKVELTIKADNPGPYNAVGQVIKISYTIKNTGTGPLPGAVTVTSDKTTVSCPSVNTVGNFDDALDVNEAINCTADYSLTEADLNKGSVTNIAAANINGILSDPVTFEVLTGPTTLLPVTAQTTLKLTTSANPVTYNQVGQLIAFTYVIQNNGTVNLGPAQFTVSDNLISTTPFNCGPANTTLTPNATVTCTATYTITQNDLSAVSITNIATASGGGAGPSQTASATVNRSGTTLTVTTSASPSTYNQAGQLITFTYVIKNSGTGNAGPAQFTVSDSLINAAPFNCGPANTTLAPNATVTCTATYTVTQADMTAVSITNIATASGGGAGPSASASTTINKTNDIQHKVVADEWLWQIARCYGVDPRMLAADNRDRIPNPNQISPGMVLIVKNPGSYSKYYGPPCVERYLVQSTDSWNSIALKYNADPAILQLVNSNTLTVGGTVIVPRNSAGGPIAPPPQNTALTLTTSANPLTYDQAGQVITFSYVIKNTGTGSLGPAQFTVSDRLISAAPFNCGASNTTLAPNATVTCSATYTITQNDLTAVSVTNIATASGGGAGPSPSASATINRGTKALKLTTSANPLTYSQVGQAITFTYVIQNSGTTTLGPAQFTVSDNLISATPFNCGAANTTVAPNATVTCTAAYIVTQNDLTAVSITNIATASGGGAGPSPSASATVNKGVAALALTTSANPLTYNQLGQNITFSYTIRNSGNTTLGPTQFTVSDHLISAAPFNCGLANTTLAPNATVTCTAVYAITQNDLTAVSITNIATASGGGVGPSPSASTTIIKQ